jgi:ATP-dependent helicase/nuclease subunit A
METYLDQLALYRHALSSVYQGRVIACAILWTSAPSLMPIPADLLDAAERRLFMPVPESVGNPGSPALFP